MREITDEVKKVIIGNDEVVDMVFAAILAQGHVLGFRHHRLYGF